MSSWLARTWLARTALTCIMAGMATVTSAVASFGQSVDSGGGAPVVLNGPPPPVPPAVVNRDDRGRVTIRAVALTESLSVDGRLDESLYASVPAISDFIQQEPVENAPATERTEVWIFFDENNVYVAARLWESEPDRVIANEMRRDNTTIFNGNDNFAFAFDTFYDRRNLVSFETNPIGGRLDMQVTNESQINTDWNPVWQVEVGQFEAGWTLEASVPFKSLRYRPGREQVWGVNLRRFNLWKNEWSFVTPIPNSFGPRGMLQASLAATLVGIEAPGGSGNLEIKPYAVSDLSSDTTVTPHVSNDVGGDVGIDVKWSPTENLIADFTVNTDFAQVEADERQVNLTRFSLFFPEKREFFLENQGTFAFGGVGTRAGGNAPVLFYSRRIGLDQRAVVPIQGGGRLTGRVGRSTLGVVSIRTDDEPVSGAPPTTFSVIRFKRDVLRRSSIGLMVTDRSIGQGGTGRNTAYGVDGTFAFFDNVAINTYWARTRTAGAPTEDDTSYRLQFQYAGDRYGLQIERLLIGKQFAPEIGFVRRDDMRRSFGEVRFSPRPADSGLVRRYSWTGSVDYVEDEAGHRLETRDVEGEFAIEFENTDRFAVTYTDSYELLPRPFRIGPGVTLPVGEYDWATVRIGHTFGPQRTVPATVSVERGTFYNGRKTSLSVSQIRVNPSSQLSIEPRYSANWVDLEEGSFTTHLVGSRVTFTATPLMFISALVQYSSAADAVSTNVRWRWEYQPGSELFVVFNEERDTGMHGFPQLLNRALIVKLNRLWRP